MPTMQQGPETRPLKERLADLEKRIDELETKAKPVASSDHEVSELLNDLRGKRQALREHVERGSGAPAGQHGVAGTFASTKDLGNPVGDREGGAPKDRSNTHENVQETSDRQSPDAFTLSSNQEAEAAIRDMEQAVERGLTRFR